MDTKPLIYNGCCFGQETAFLLVFHMTMLIEASLRYLSAEPLRCPLALSQTAGEAQCHVPHFFSNPAWLLTPCPPKPHGPPWVSQPGIASPSLCPATLDSVSHFFSSLPSHNFTTSACTAPLVVFCAHTRGACLLICCWSISVGWCWSVETSFAFHYQVHRGTRRHGAGSGGELLVSGARGPGDVRPVWDPPRTRGNAITALIHTSKKHFIP